MDNKINISNDDNIKKCLKSYLTGKKCFDIDKNKAFEYFKQCLKYLSNIKNKDVQYKDILLETESECNKYIALMNNLSSKKPSSLIAFLIRI